MEEYLYSNLLTFYNGIDTIKVKGWTDYDNLTSLIYTPTQLFTETNITSKQTITLSGRSSKIETITSKNGAFEFSRITLTSNPITIPTYSTKFDTTNNRIVKTGTNYINKSFNTLIRYTINWSKLAQNIMFFNTSDSITELKGDYLFTDTMTINDEIYFISNFTINTPISLRNFTAFSNVYSLFPDAIAINEDRFSYCDSQFIGTERYDLMSIVNPNNEVNRNNIESDINNIISRNVVYNTGYLQNTPKTTVASRLDQIKDLSLRNFYTYGNNPIYLSEQYKDFYNIETTGNDQPHWNSTFKNWYDWTIGADRTLPLRNIGIGTQLNDVNFNSFYEAWENIGPISDKTTSDMIYNGESPTQEKIFAIKYWTNPEQAYKSSNILVQIPYNYMLDLEGTNITTMHVGHDIITSNYVMYNNSDFHPSITFNSVNNTNVNINAYDPNEYQALETILNNIPYINLIGGSTTLLVLGVLSLALILKVGHIIK